MPSAQEAQSHVASLNHRRRQTLPKELMQDRKPVYVHNIFDLHWIASLGSLRTWNIPACPEGREYVSLKIPGVIADEYDTGDGNGTMGVMPVMGERVAEEIVGSKSPERELSYITTNKEWFGVFWSHNEIPSKDELAKAKENLFKMAEYMVADGNRRQNEGHSDKPGIGVNSIQPMHRKFAKMLGQAPEWAKGTRQMIDCPNCGDPVKPGIITHVACGWIFDHERYEANKPKNKGGRPRKDEEAVA